MTRKEARWLAENAIDNAEQSANYSVLDRKLKTALIDAFADVLRKALEVKGRHGR